MNNICIIGIYFGKKPKNFDIWLSSCGKNSKIDFLVVGYFEVDFKLENVKYINMKFDNFIKLAERKLDCQICEVGPYKICDLKPVYGMILDEYICEYLYWGHCDFDMIFGNLDKFLKKYNYEQYDKFLPLGHLCLYRNDGKKHYLEDTKTTYNAKKIFKSENNCLFDEIGINKIYYKYNFFDKIIFADIDPAYRQFREVEQLSYYPKIYLDYRNTVGNINFMNQVFFYEDGGVYKAYLSGGKVKVKEYMYIHIQKRNIINKMEGAYDSFFIDNVLTKKDKGIPDELIIKKHSMTWYFNFIDRARYQLMRIKRYIDKHIIKKNTDNIVIPKDIFI